MIFRRCHEGSTGPKSSWTCPVKSEERLLKCRERVKASKRRQFSEDFAREAIRIVSTSGRDIAVVADKLGIGKSTLERRDMFSPRKVIFPVRMRIWGWNYRVCARKPRYCVRSVIF